MRRANGETAHRELCGRISGRTRVKGHVKPRIFASRVVRRTRCSCGHNRTREGQWVAILTHNREAPTITSGRGRSIRGEVETEELIALRRRTGQWGREQQTGGRIACKGHRRLQHSKRITRNGNIRDQRDVQSVNQEPSEIVRTLHALTGVDRHILLQIQPITIHTTVRPDNGRLIRTNKSGEEGFGGGTRVGSVVSHFRHTTRLY